MVRNNVIARILRTRRSQEQKNEPINERHSYENEKHGHPRNHRDDTIKMDAVGAGDVGARRRPRRDRLQ